MQEGSAIGRVGRLVLPFLRLQADVDVWEPQQVARANADFVLPRPRYAKTALQGYDAVFYQLGNHADNHGAIWRCAQSYPGIVVAHDVNLHALVRRTPPEPDQDRPDYLELLERLYGPTVRQHALDALRGARPDAPWVLPAVNRYPMLEAVLVGARAVLVHSDSAAELVRERFIGHVATAPLPWARTQRAQAPGRSTLGIGAEKVVVLTVGHVLPNRHVDLLVAALGADPQLRAAVTLVSAGEVTATARAGLQTQADGLGVQLQIRGQVGPTELAGLLAAADVSANLRHPHTESGSASLAEAMLHGLPVVVLRSGPHGEIPDGVGAVVDPAATAAELAAALRPLVLDPDARRQAGDRAHSYAQAVHRPQSYAARLLSLARFPTSGAPTAALLRTLATAARESGLRLDGALGATLSGAVADVLGAPGAPTGAPMLRH